MYKSLYEQLPTEFKNISEFKAIMDIEYIEIERVESLMQSVLNENFIDKSSIWGVKEYEKQMKILADIPLEDLDFRKFRLKNRKSDKVPFTLNWLKEKLTNLFGAENFKLYIDSDKYTLYLKITTYDYNSFKEVVINLKDIIPCNLIFDTENMQKFISSSLYIASNQNTLHEEIFHTTENFDADNYNEIKVFIGSINRNVVEEISHKTIFKDNFYNTNDIKMGSSIEIIEEIEDITEEDKNG